MSDDRDRDVVIFTEAVRLPAGQRAGFVERACAGDETLRRKVLDLLSAHERSAISWKTRHLGRGRPRARNGPQRMDNEHPTPIMTFRREPMSDTPIRQIRARSIRMRRRAAAEVFPDLKRGCPITNQPQPDLMHQGSGLKRLAGASEASLEAASRRNSS